MRDCISGESQINKECIECGPGTYSIDVPSNECKDCPEGAECYGSNSMAPMKGYWRSSNATGVFFNCPFANACKGGEIDE